MKAERLIPSNVNILGPINNTDADFNNFVLNNCSFYLHMANEPQATTILENCARGLLPLLSSQSGFNCPDAIYLHEEDIKLNHNIIKKALSMPNDEFSQRRHGVRNHVRTFHSWTRICEQMYASIRSLIAGQKVDQRGENYS